jgi:hypothetical protein
MLSFASLADILVSLRSFAGWASGGEGERGFHWERFPGLGRGARGGAGEEAGFCSKAAMRSRSEPGLGLGGEEGLDIWTGPDGWLRWGTSAASCPVIHDASDGFFRGPHNRSNITLITNI